MQQQYDENNSVTSTPNWNEYENNVLYDIDNKPLNEKKSSAVRKSKNNVNKAIDKIKRKQVKNACVNCQKACKKCDDGRPCRRCVKLGLTATCRDSDRKERKKGVKRGPYKKRQVFNKDKPVYPKLLTEQHQPVHIDTKVSWKQPEPSSAAIIYEIVPQVLSHARQQPFHYDEEVYCVPSQQLSPTNSSGFFDADETLYHAYGYDYTNNNATITTTSSPLPSSTSVLLDHSSNNKNNNHSIPICHQEVYSKSGPSSPSSLPSPIGPDLMIFNNAFIPAMVSSINGEQEYQNLLQRPFSTPIQKEFNNNSSLIGDFNSYNSIAFYPQQQQYWQQNNISINNYQQANYHYGAAATVPARSSPITSWPTTTF